MKGFFSLRHEGFFRYATKVFFFSLRHEGFFSLRREWLVLKRFFRYVTKVFFFSLCYEGFLSLRHEGLFRYATKTISHRSRLR